MRHYEVTLRVDVEADYANVEDFTEKEVESFNKANKDVIQVVNVVKVELLGEEG